MGIHFVKYLTFLAFLCSTVLEILSVKKLSEEENDQAKKENEQVKGKKKKQVKEKKKQVKEEVIYRNISIGLTFVYGIYLVVDMVVGSAAISIISWVQNHKIIVCIYIGIAAVLPPVLAHVERKRGTFEAEKSYEKKNLLYNLLGVIAISGLFILVQGMISDLYLLKRFYIEEIAALIIPICVWMVLWYQKTEKELKEKGGLDHDAYLNSWNQRMNLLHLFNMYSLAIISVIYIVAYTIYCQRYHINRNMSGWYYIALILTLIFFYAMMLHQHRYLNIIAYIVIPVILISSVYWMSWFSMNDKARFLQWLFIAVNSTIYILILYSKEGVGIFGKDRKENAASNSFLMVFPIIVVILYTVVWSLPKAIDRLLDNEAHSYIDMLCIDTDKDADDVIQKAMEQDMYDEQNNTYDAEMFVRFLSSEFEKELMEKGVIEKSGEIPARDDLLSWYFDELRRRQE